jgi:hypothetical protein
MANYHRLQYDLELQVQKRNELNALALEVYDRCAEILAPYVGKKICKVTPYKTWIKALKDKFDEIDSLVGTRNRLIFTFSNCLIMAEITICFDSNDRYFYKDKWFTLAILDHDQVSLSSIMGRPECKTDYDAAEVETNIVSIEQLKDQIESLEKSVREFEIR